MDLGQSKFQRHTRGVAYSRKPTAQSLARITLWPLWLSVPAKG